jgi:hypothetical protein
MDGLNVQRQAGSRTIAPLTERMYLACKGENLEQSGGDMSRGFMLSLSALSFCVVSCAHTEAQGVKGDVKNFVAQYVAAFNAKDRARLNALLHPGSLACVTPENKGYYDEALAVHLRDPIPANYTFTISLVNEKNMKSMEYMWHFPVPPTQQLQIEYEQGEDSGTAMVYLVQENGRWLQDDPCATEQTLKEFRDDAPAREQRIAEHKALAAAIKEPLRSELIGLLRGHKSSTATKRYQEASGKDYETCMFVIYELEPEARPGSPK